MSIRPHAPSGMEVREHIEKNMNKTEICGFFYMHFFCFGHFELLEMSTTFEISEFTTDSHTMTGICGEAGLETGHSRPSAVIHGTTCIEKAVSEMVGVRSSEQCHMQE